MQSGARSFSSRIMTQRFNHSQPHIRPWFDRDVSVRCFAGATLALASAAARRTVGDWPFFLDMSRRMLSSNGFHVFAEHTNIQSGPVALMAVRMLSIGPMNSRGGRAIVFFVAAIAMVELLIRVRRTMSTSKVWNHVTSPAVVLTMLWWTYFESYGHLDDALVVVIFAAALLLRTRGNPAWVGVLVGVAIAIKPWAVLLLPLTLMPHNESKRRWVPLAVSVSVAALWWAPFMVVAPGTLRGLKPSVKLGADSVLQLFHFRASNFPAGLRVVQLCGAVAVAFAAVRSRRLAGLLLGGVAVRVGLDPATWRYYTSSLVVGALFWDVCQSRRRFPVMTLAVTALMAPPWVVSDPGLRALGRLAACLLAVTVVIWPERPTAAPSEHEVLDDDCIDAVGAAT